MPHMPFISSMVYRASSSTMALTVLMSFSEGVEIGHQGQQIILISDTQLPNNPQILQ
jgi:hypothetical protein